MAIRFVPQSAGIRELLDMAGVRRDLLERGERVGARAKSLAPVVSGAYRASIAVTDDEHAERAVVHVSSTVPYAGKVEAKHRVLGRSIDAARG